MRKTLHPPPPPFEIQNQNKGIEDIIDIDSNCPYLLFGETTSHLTSKWNIIFFNVENSIKREMKKNCFCKRRKHEILKKKKFILFFSIFKKFINKFKQHSINIKNYTAHPHDLVHIPAKFRENIAMRFWVTVRKLNVTDRQTDRRTDGGRCNISRPQAYGASGR